MKAKVLAMQSIFRQKLAPFKHEFVVDFGETADTILRISREKKAELIALGVRHGFAGPHLRTSIAYRTMCEANCPVLTSQ